MAPGDQAPEQGRVQWRAAWGPAWAGPWTQLKAPGTMGMSYMAFSFFILKNIFIKI